MSTARVSVVVAVHDVEAFLPACVDSVLAQTYPDVDVVLVDDGSTDGSGALCDAAAAADARVRVVHQANGGLSAARNAGLAVADGVFVHFLDGDDWCDPGLLATAVSAAEEHGADLVVTGCHVDVVDEDGILISTTEQRPAAQVVTVGHGVVPEVDVPLVNLLGYAWNKLYRRELLEAHGLRFTEGLSLIEDIVFNEAALRAARTVVVVPEAYVHYVQRPRVTLGTQERDDYLDLRLRAVGGVAGVLTNWGVPVVRRNVLLDRLRVDALYAALRAAVAPPRRAFRERRRRVGGLVRSEAARRLVDDVDDVAALTLAERLFIRAVRTRSTTLLTVLVWLRSRGSRR